MHTLCHRVYACLHKYRMSRLDRHGDDTIRLPHTTWLRAASIRNNWLSIYALKGSQEGVSYTCNWLLMRLMLLMTCSLRCLMTKIAQAIKYYCNRDLGPFGMIYLSANLRNDTTPRVKCVIAIRAHSSMRVSHKPEPKPHRFHLTIILICSCVLFWATLLYLLFYRPLLVSFLQRHNRIFDRAHKSDTQALRALYVRIHAHDM